MSVIKLIDEKSIEIKIQEIAKSIYNEFKNEQFVILSVLNGSFIFTADIAREISKFSTDFEVYFIRAKSYENTESTGNLNLYDKIPSIEGKNVLIVDDIYDSGLTLKSIYNEIKNMKPKFLKIAVFLIKGVERKFDLDIDFYCFEIPDKFVVGYGLDYNGKYRGLPFVGYIEE